MSTLDLRIWGKFDKNTGRTHPAILHMCDVGHVASAILAILPETEINFLCKHLNLKKEETMLVLPFIFSCHDLGKITPKFQNCAEIACNPIKSDYEFPEGEVNIRHERFTRLIAENLFYEFSAKYKVCELLGGHHGRYTKIPNKIRDRAGYRYFITQSGWDISKWREQQDIAYKTLSKVFPVEASVFHKMKISDDVFYYLSGLLSFSDWLASNGSFFPYEITDVSQYVELSKQRAVAAVEAIEWEPKGCTAPDFEEMFKTANGCLHPNVTQQKLAELVSDTTEPSMLIVEDTTGNGKTEGALYVANRLMKNVGHRGIHILMPTMATANAMEERFENYLHNISAGANLQLIHSKASAFQPFQSQENGETDGSTTTTAEEWYDSSKKKFLAQFAYGTIDQAMMGVIFTKYFFMRLFGLTNKVVIFDEIHGYDAYMVTIIKNLIVWLKRLNCSVILLSATLPAKSRKEFVESFGGKFIEEMAYPRVTLVNSKRVDAFNVSTGTPPVFTELEHVHGDSAFEHTMRKIECGGCAAVVCNTVKQSQKACSWFRNAGISCQLIHSRFTDVDRDRLEKEIQQYGKGGVRPSRSVLIGTQIIEQSLDLDFDYMLSFLAPVDLLIQRMGRLWRHNLINRIIKQRQFGIAYENNDKGELEKYVYPMVLMLLTRKVLEGRRYIATPTDVESLVETVYNLPDELLTKDGLKHKHDFLKSRESMQNDARNYLVPFNDAGESDEEIPESIISPIDDVPLTPMTRLITPTTKIVIMKHDWSLYDGSKIEFKKPSNKDIKQIQRNTCSVVGYPLFDYFSQRTIKDWKHVPQLSRLAVLKLDKDDQATVGGLGYDATFSYDSVYGLRTEVIWKK